MMWQKHLPGLVASLVLLYSHNGHAQIATYDVRLGNLLHMQQGIGWPLYLNVAAGHDALMRLSERLENQQSCEVTTPKGATFNVRNPPSPRYEAWSDGCGVRVKNVVPVDAGRWRMTASRGTHSITGWTEVQVADQISSYTPGAISLEDGQTHTLVDLSSLNNSYCLVSQPFTESSLVSGQCRVTLDRTTRAVQGRWSVLLGIPGRVTELHVDTTVAVESERLDVGYVREVNVQKLHLYCNILHTTKNITFCRFQKTTAVSGFNVMDGLSDGRYSYYGEGVFKKQCGMTIESVTAQDFGTWRCTLGVMERVDNVIHQLTPMQALVTVPAEEGTRSIRRDIQSPESEMRRLFVQKESDLTITCRAEASLGYCWFQHPNGSQLTPMERINEEPMAFWYTGENLQAGDCGITFTNVSVEDAGTWTCHMGYRFQLGIEKTNQVDVRVTGALAATELEVDAEVGGGVTLHCRTANGPRPLEYCRFLGPSNIGMSLDSTVDVQHAILHRFYFTPERSLDYGDCSLTINPVSEEDFGEWTCAASLHNHMGEAKDSVRLYTRAARMPRLRAGFIGALVGVAVLALVLAVTVWHKKGRPLPTIPWSWSNPIHRFSHRSDNNSFEMVTVGDRSGSDPISDRKGSGSASSTNSTTSNTELQEQA